MEKDMTNGFDHLGIMTQVNKTYHKKSVFIIFLAMTKTVFIFSIKSVLGSIYNWCKNTGCYVVLIQLSPIIKYKNRYSNSIFINIKGHDVSYFI